MSTRELLRIVGESGPRLKTRLRELVEAESPSEDKPSVDRAVTLVAAWSQSLGGRVRRHRQKAFGDLLEVNFGPSRSHRPDAPGRILLLGHLDTVYPLGTLAYMPWRETRGKLWGPGILDMKAGVVMALEAVAAARQIASAAGKAAPPPRPITLLLVSEEEVGSPVSRPLTERLAADCSAVLVLEPAQGLACKTARKGVGHFTLRVQGVSSHAGVDFEKGHSAVREMARLVEQVSSFTDLGRGRTVNVGVLHGGTQSNVVAAACVAEVDVRIASPGDAARVERLFRGLKTSDTACTLTVSGAINRPPMERKAGTVRLFRSAQKLAAEIGLSLEEAATGGGSDGNFTAALGLPTLDGMGAVGTGAHSPHEHVLQKHLAERTALLAAMLLPDR